MKSKSKKIKQPHKAGQGRKQNQRNTRTKNNKQQQQTRKYTAKKNRETWTGGWNCKTQETEQDGKLDRRSDTDRGEHTDDKHRGWLTNRTHGNTGKGRTWKAKHDTWGQNFKIKQEVTKPKIWNFICLIWSTTTKMWNIVNITGTSEALTLRH